MQACLGQVHEILVEGVGRKGGAQGRTRTNRVVHVPDEAGVLVPGTFLDARITGAHPHHLTAEPVPATVG